MKKHKPIRMCASCRKRELQSELIRLQKDGNIVRSFNGIGRSFYICKDCLLNDKHILNKISGRLKVNITSLEEVIKELRSNVKN